MSKLYDLLSAICGKIKKPDWNQNDSTAPDYVKNRPFYTGDPVETALVEESTVSFANHSGVYAAEFPSTFSATVGETYKVSWDGASYECACVNFDDILSIGNLYIAGEGSDTGEPFLMSVFNGSGILIYTADTADSHTFSISAFVTEVVKIDEKYLPEIPAEKLPEIPVEIPVIEINGVIYSSIGNLSQPGYTVKNLSYAAMLGIFNSGICLLKDNSNYYYLPVSVNVSDGTLKFRFVCYTNCADYVGLVYVELDCTENSTRFFRNSYHKIPAEIG